VEAARLTARRIRPEDVERLRARLHERQELIGGDPAAFVDADLDFHHAIVELSGNAVLVGLFDVVRPVLRAALIEMVTHEAALPDVSCAHTDVLEALARGDAEAAVAATADNLEGTMAFIRAEMADR
ncbi:FadR/GntR family transcriptional regulator, partial [Streptosporangium algeriense]